MNDSDRLPHRRRWEECPDCLGKGERLNPASSAYTVCSPCEGLGTIEVRNDE